MLKSSIIKKHVADVMVDISSSKVLSFNQNAKLKGTFLLVLYLYLIKKNNAIPKKAISPLTNVRLVASMFFLVLRCEYCGCGLIKKKE